MRASRTSEIKGRKTYILLGLLNAGIDLGDIPLNFVVDGLELVLGNDSKACFSVEFSLPNGG